MPKDKLKKPNKKYDLEDRTTSFGEDIVRFAKKILKNPVTLPLINQIVRSGTAIGANYAEADGAESKKDFKHKIGICKKEAKETKHWLKIIIVAAPELENEAKRLWKEAQELTLIFSAIVRR